MSSHKELLAKLEAARAGRAMEGERRVVTMLFCDVKGSTAMAETLDPEEWDTSTGGSRRSGRHHTGPLMSHPSAIRSSVPRHR